METWNWNKGMFKIQSGCGHACWVVLWAWLLRGSWYYLSYMPAERLYLDSILDCPISITPAYCGYALYSCIREAIYTTGWIMQKTIYMCMPRPQNITTSAHIRTWLNIRAFPHILVTFIHIWLWANSNLPYKRKLSYFSISVIYTVYINPQVLKVTHEMTVRKTWTDMSQKQWDLSIFNEALWRRHIRHNQTVRRAVEYCMYI